MLLESVYRKRLIRGESANGTLAEKPANHKSSREGKTSRLTACHFTPVKDNLCSILNYNMNIHGVIKVTLRSFSV